MPARNGLIACHPGHDITITGPGPFGRYYLDCSCGHLRRSPSSRAANVAALLHHHDAGGCNCPPRVTALEYHPSAPTDPGTATAGPAAVA